MEQLASSYEHVRSGLSEKVNFEMALFRATEICQMRSIDEVIRKLQACVDNQSVPAFDRSAGSPCASNTSATKSIPALIDSSPMAIPSSEEPTPIPLPDDLQESLKNNRELIQKLPPSTRQKLVDLFHVELDA
jgi:hypothetical protein